MLKRIRCDKFREKEIIFHPGLNAVIGDEIASNSIGKSTLLMIIDFVFGGSEYIKQIAMRLSNLALMNFCLSLISKMKSYISVVVQARTFL